MKKTRDTLVPQDKAPAQTPPPSAKTPDDLPPGFFKTVERMVERNKGELKKFLDE